jgi:hypothetical protein
MQVFHTAGDPPSKGSSILPNMGCNTNISEALTNSVVANKKTVAALFLDGLFIMLR